MGASTAHNPIGLHSLLQGYIFLNQRQTRMPTGTKNPGKWTRDPGIRYCQEPVQISSHPQTSGRRFHITAQPNNDRPARDQCLLASNDCYPHRGGSCISSAAPRKSHDRTKEKAKVEIRVFPHPVLQIVTASSLRKPEMQYKHRTDLTIFSALQVALM
jgi:hypothetical protein